MKSVKIDLKEIRGKLNITQTQLAERLDVNMRTVQNWERAGEVPVKVYKALQYEILSEDHQPVTEKSNIPDMENSNRLNRYIELLEKENEELKQELYQLKAKKVPDHRAG